MHLALQLFKLPVVTAHVANAVTSFDIAEAKLSSQHAIFFHLNTLQCFEGQATEELQLKIT